MKTIAHLIFEYQGKQFEINDVWDYEWVNEESVHDMEFWWTDGNGSCDCNRSLCIGKTYSDFAEMDCGDEIELISIDINLERGVICNGNA